MRAINHILKLDIDLNYFSENSISLPSNEQAELRTVITYSGKNYFPKYVSVSALKGQLEIQSECKKYELSIIGSVKKIQENLVIDFNLKELMKKQQEFKISHGIVTISLLKDESKRISTNSFNIFIDNARQNLPPTLFN